GDLVAVLAAAHADPRARVVAGECGLGQRPGVGLQRRVAVDRAVTAQVVAGLRAVGGEGEVVGGPCAAVVVEVGIARVGLGCGVGEGGGVGYAVGDLVAVLRAADAVPGACGVARAAGLRERPGVGLQRRVPVDRAMAAEVVAGLRAVGGEIEVVGGPCAAVVV